MPSSAPAPSTADGHPDGARRAARNVVAVVAGELVGKGATLVFTVVVARMLGPTEFGAFSYALAFGMMLATLVSWGFDAEVGRRGAADADDLGDVLAQTVVLRALHALPVLAVGGLVGVLTRPSPSAAVALLLVLAASVLDSFGDGGRAAAAAREQLGRTVVALIAQRLATCGLAVGVLAAGGGLVAVCAAYVLSSALGLVVLVAVLRGIGVRPRWAAARRPALADVSRRAWLIGVDAVLSMALFRIDALMLGALAGDREVATYAVAYRLMETVLFVNWAVSRSLFPAMVRAGGGAALLRVTRSAVAVAGALLVPYGVLVLLEGGALLRLLFGDGYGADSRTALQLLAFAPVAFAVSYFGSYLLIVRQQKGRLLVTTLFGIAVNVALNAALIPSLGARGAAAATTVSYALQGALTVMLVVPGTGLLRVDGALLLPLLAAAPMALALLLLSLPVLLEAPLAGAVYVVAYLALTRWRDPEQMALLRSVVSR